MVKDEFRSDVGKKFFAQHQAELEQGLQQLAHALGCNQNFPHSAEFFKAFIDGFWDPFQEACETGNQQQKEITQLISGENGFGVPLCLSEKADISVMKS